MHSTMQHTYVQPLHSCLPAPGGLGCCELEEKKGYADDSGADEEGQARFDSVAPGIEQNVGPNEVPEGHRHGHGNVEDRLVSGGRLEIGMCVWRYVRKQNSCMRKSKQKL